MIKIRIVIGKYSIDQDNSTTTTDTCSVATTHMPPCVYICNTVTRDDKQKIRRNLGGEKIEFMHLPTYLPIGILQPKATRI